MGLVTVRCHSYNISITYVTVGWGRGAGRGVTFYINIVSLTGCGVSVWKCISHLRERDVAQR